MIEDWHIYILWHADFDWGRFESVVAERPSQFTFVRGYTTRYRAARLPSSFNTLNEADLPGADLRLQSRGYHAPSIIRNLWKSGYTSNFQYVGFLEYDMVPTSLWGADRLI